MFIKIRHVEKIKGSYGETGFPTPRSAVITISRQLNKSLASYASTMLHELLHVWIRILAIKGFEVDDETEHDFIYAAEKRVLKEFKRVHRMGRK